MTVLLCGVAGDTGNVRPVPRVDADGRFEYVPIPEKGATSETATYGSIDREHSDGALADVLDGVRPGSDGNWVSDSAAVRDQAVHRDPNFQALTYGEHRPPYVAALRDLDPGDIVAFYAGFPGPETDYKHRYVFGYFTVAESPVVLTSEMNRDEKRAVLADHPENAHAKRFAGHGDLYSHDPAFTDRPRPVVIVPGREPGGLLDRAVRISDERRGPNYYMAADVAETLEPTRRTDRGAHLGGIKPAVSCDIGSSAFRQFVADRSS